MPKLSLMIPTIVTRQSFFDRLMGCLNSQLTSYQMVAAEEGNLVRLTYGDDVEIVALRDNGELTIGGKRNALVKAAAGQYLAFIDDDDMVAPNYVSKILAALEHQADTIGFKLVRFVNGVRADVAIHSLRYAKWGENRVNGVIMHYERTPNHLNPTKAELVRQIEYKDKSWGEDSDYSARLYPLLKTETFIDRELYIYMYREQAQRTGEVTNRGMVGPTRTAPVAAEKHVRGTESVKEEHNRVVPVASKKYKRPPGNHLNGKY